MTNTPQEEWILEFDKKFNKKPAYADFDRKPCEITDPRVAYCLTCDRFILEEGCLCGMINSETVKRFISQEKDKSYRQGVEECIENVARLVTKKDVHTFGDLTDSLCEKFNLK